MSRFCYIGDVPYYGQEASSYCWAACLQMLCASVCPSGNSVKIPDIIGNTGFDSSGLATTTACFSKTLKRLVYQRTLRQLECRWWLPFISTVMLTRYIRWQLESGHPVMLVSAPKAHAWLIIGFDGNSFIVHDPASCDDMPCMSRVSPETLGINWSLPYYDSYCTLVIDAPVHADRPLVTTQITSEDLRFVVPGAASDDGKSEMIWYSWEHSTAGGFWLISQRRDKVYDVLPALTLALKSDHGLPVYNSTGSPQSVKTRICLENIDSQEIFFEECSEIEVPARGRAGIPVIIDLGCIRSKKTAENRQKIRFSVSVTDLSGHVDLAEFCFLIETSGLADN